MTNAYNGLISSIEAALGDMQRHDTERVLQLMTAPLSPDALISELQNGNPIIADWKHEIAKQKAAYEEAHPGEEAEHLPKIDEAMAIARKIIAPIFARDTRSDYFTRAGGNVMTGMADLWVQADDFKSDDVREAHIVEYDFVNMEAVLMALEKTLGAMDDVNKGKRRTKTSPRRVTDGLIRIVNGIVYEEFAQELANAGIEHVGTHLQPSRQSNGDEFRLLVMGLDEEQIENASRNAQQRVERLMVELGFDALPHLKYLREDQDWHTINNLKTVEEDPDLYKSYKYGGAGIKIGTAELGLDKTTAEIEHDIDLSMHANKEERAEKRAIR